MKFNRKEILDGVYAIGLTVYLPKDKALLLTDTHLGFEEAFNKTGVLIPRFQYGKIVEHINLVFEELADHNDEVEKIVILGDVKHVFGSILKQEWKETFDFIDFLKEKCSEVVLIQGNHDKILQPIATIKEIEICDYVLFDKSRVLGCHGDVVLDVVKNENKDFDKIIIGHEHAAISISNGIRSEVVKCFLVGKFLEYNLVVMPSLNFVTEGSDVLKNKPLSPFLDQDLSNFEIFVFAEDILDFGKVGDYFIE